MLFRSKFEHLCGQNLPVMVIRVYESNSVIVGYGGNEIDNDMDAIISELKHLGFIGFVFDCESIVKFRVYLNSLNGNGAHQLGD